MAEIPGSNLSELELNQTELVSLLNTHLWALWCMMNGAESYTATPPGSPSNGQVYLIAAGATGVWSGKDEQVALRVAGAWHYLDDPQEGWKIWVKDEGLYRRYQEDSSSTSTDESGWVIDDPDKVHQTITPADSVTINWALGSNASLLLDRATTDISMIGGYQGQRCVLALIDDGTGSRGLTWDVSVRGSDDTTLPSSGPGINRTNMLGFHYNQDGNLTYDLVGNNNGFV